MLHKPIQHTLIAVVAATALLLTTPFGAHMAPSGASEGKVCNHSTAHSIAVTVHAWDGWRLRWLTPGDCSAANEDATVIWSQWRNEWGAWQLSAWSVDGGYFWVADGNTASAPNDLWPLRLDGGGGPQSGWWTNWWDWPWPVPNGWQVSYWIITH